MSRPLVSEPLKIFVQKIPLILIGLVVFSVFALITTRLFEWTNFERPFDKIQSFESDKDWAGPKIGEIISLSGFKNESGHSLTDSRADGYILLSLLDEECKMSQSSTDLVKEVSSFSSNKNIHFSVISYARKTKKPSFSSLVNNFGSEQVFIWDDSVPRQVGLEKMVIPSHILIEASGLVVAKFPGGSHEEETRQKMSKQIIDDVLLILQR